MKAYKTFIGNRTNQLLMGALGVILILAFFLTPKEAEEQTVAAPAEADTYIPAGHVLIPLEISNIESIKGILGSHGVVDLFRASEDGTHEPRLVAKHVKLIRAPLDREHFAVLVLESEASPILKGLGPIIAVIQNPKAQSTEVFRNAQRTSRVIVGP